MMSLYVIFLISSSNRLTLFDPQAEISSGQITALLEATGNTEVEAFYPIIFANYLSDPDKVAALLASPGGGGGGGGGGDGGKLNLSCVLDLAFVELFLIFPAALFQLAVMQAAKKKRRRKKKRKRKKWIWVMLSICSEVMTEVITKLSNKIISKLYTRRSTGLIHEQALYYNPFRGAQTTVRV